MSKEFTYYLEKISISENLETDEASSALNLILKGEVSDAEIAAFLMGMRSKGETVGELTAFVEVMRKESVPVEVNSDGAVDLCGTGGDKSGTFNISTAAMFVVAGAGVPVLKHGNRSVSSKSGSYDVLEELGAVPNLQKAGVEKMFDETGMAFMFAPNFHPAMKYVMPARRSLKMRTFFNMLGPLLNPADVKSQVIGAFSREAASMMAQILANLDTERAYTLNAHDGLDEVSLTSQSEIFELQSNLTNGSVTFDPESLNYQKESMESLMGGDAKKNASIIKNIMDGEATRAQQNIVTLNAAFAIHAAGASDSLQDANQKAIKSIETGEASRKLDEFITVSQKLSQI
ncbi:anthranilate phosphoribosyltransferase [Rhodohalobacter halophilus]|uniref:anthranilate phosphoribosyltransferase n=1 Tax=Rhodohalobacter halophilus TaxID=1812810 RepID=UPI00083FD6E6|nr:anthranilate phosphoribosyltransferase [Rhodohalobacter halophilus]